jgi:hypothetical protein
MHTLFVLIVNPNFDIFFSMETNQMFIIYDDYVCAIHGLYN